MVGPAGATVGGIVALVPAAHAGIPVHAGSTLAALHKAGEQVDLLSSECSGCLLVPGHLCLDDVEGLLIDDGRQSVRNNDPFIPARLSS